MTACLSMATMRARGLRGSCRGRGREVPGGSVLRVPSRMACRNCRQLLHCRTLRACLWNADKTLTGGSPLSSSYACLMVPSSVRRPATEVGLASPLANQVCSITLRRPVDADSKWFCSRCWSASEPPSGAACPTSVLPKREPCSLSAQYTFRESSSRRKGGTKADQGSSSCGTSRYSMSSTPRSGQRVLWRAAGSCTKASTSRCASCTTELPSCSATARSRWCRWQNACRAV
mmetsp:Transcript_20735/g.45350  ORF Transcript_20735/g.45350 Transcript_20735/m.45350 type:complete len:232 (-) Transcript_20735:163-858(-)